MGKVERPSILEKGRGSVGSGGFGFNPQTRGAAGNGAGNNATFQLQPRGNQNNLEGMQNTQQPSSNTLSNTSRAQRFVPIMVSQRQAPVGPERFYYDKNSYTGTAVRGGPQTNDRKPEMPLDSRTKPV